MSVSTAMLGGHITLGCTMLIPSGSNGYHLFVSVLDQKIINGKPHVLLVSFCSTENILNHDQSCIVNVGEHSFVQHETYINYSKPRVDSVEDVLKRLSEGYFIQKHENVSSDLLGKIQAGLKKSNRVPRYIKDDWGI